jgi:hypothetical protein
MQRPEKNLYWKGSKTKRDARKQKQRRELQSKFFKLYVEFPEFYCKYPELYSPTTSTVPRVLPLLGNLQQVDTRGRTMRPSHLFGKCGCHVCVLAVFEGRRWQRLYCTRCGFCMFVMCQKMFDYAWNTSLNVNSSDYSCFNKSFEPEHCFRRQRETHRFMLWLCWTHLREAQVGLGKLPRVLIKIISNLMC